MAEVRPERLLDAEVIPDIVRLDEALPVEHAVRDADALLHDEALKLGDRELRRLLVAGADGVADSVAQLDEDDDTELDTESDAQSVVVLEADAVLQRVGVPDGHSETDDVTLKLDVTLTDTERDPMALALGKADGVALAVAHSEELGNGEPLVDCVPHADAVAVTDAVPQRDGELDEQRDGDGVALAQDDALSDDVHEPTLLLLTETDGVMVGVAQLEELWLPDGDVVIDELKDAVELGDLETRDDDDPDGHAVGDVVELEHADALAAEERELTLLALEALERVALAVTLGESDALTDPEAVRELRLDGEIAEETVADRDGPLEAEEESDGAALRLDDTLPVDERELTRLTVAARDGVAVAVPHEEIVDDSVPDKDSDAHWEGVAEPEPEVCRDDVADEHCDNDDVTLRLDDAVPDEERVLTRLTVAALDSEAPADAHAESVANSEPDIVTDVHCDALADSEPETLRDGEPDAHCDSDSAPLPLALAHADTERELTRLVLAAPETVALTDAHAEADTESVSKVVTDTLCDAVIDCDEMALNDSEPDEQ